MTTTEAAAIHDELRRNAETRDALRGSILEAIREGRPEPPEAAQMRAVLADDERLRPIHSRVCRDIRYCPL